MVILTLNFRVHELDLERHVLTLTMTAFIHTMSSFKLMQLFTGQSIFMKK